MASPYDSMSLPLKAQAAFNEAAAYWGDPNVYPTTTDAQKALMRDYGKGAPITSGFFAVLLVREGFDDQSTYAAVSARVAALETTVVNVFAEALGL